MPSQIGVVLCLIVMLTSCAGASAGAGTSEGLVTTFAITAAPDTTGGEGVPGASAPRDTTPAVNVIPERAEGAIDSRDDLANDPAQASAVTGRQSPRAAVWRSVLYPGWGQLANGKPFKACVVFGVEAYFIGVAVLSSRRAQDVLDKSRYATSEEELAAFEERYDRYVNRRNTYFWWLGAAVLYSMLDAYVDASLSEVEEGFSDPPPLFLESGAGESGELRLGIGTRF